MKLFITVITGLMLLTQLPGAIGQTKVGVGTNSPEATLHVANGSVLFTGLANENSLLIPHGTGARMSWHGAKAAFRAGYVSGTQWDENNIGYFSFAAGGDVKATGNNSISLGSASNALGDYAIAIGYTCTAANKAAAIGANAEALSPNSIAIGTSAKAENVQAMAFGSSVISNGANSTAIGHLVTASGTDALATGYNTVGNGERSTAMGSYVSTNSKKGSFIIGDASSQLYLLSTLENQATMRFMNGYNFFTNAQATVGVRVVAGGNAWSTISDKNRKENFLPVDGEAALEKISGFNLGTWNYTGQDASKFRHYGPMAQEFFEAFGKDAIGISGCDTLINQADFDGVNLVAIQALVKRTEQLQQQVELLQKQVRLLSDKKDMEPAFQYATKKEPCQE